MWVSPTMTPSLSNETNVTLPKPNRFKKIRDANIHLRNTISKFRIRSRLANQGKLVCVTINKSAIPVLEEVGNDKLSTFSRWMHMIQFIFCIASVTILCWYLYEQTTNNPISDGVQRIHVSNGSFPSVAIIAGSLIEESFLRDAERLLNETEEAFNSTQKTRQGKFGPKEKIALFYILGHLVSGTGPSSIPWFLRLTERLENYSMMFDYYPANNYSDPMIRRAIAYIKPGLKNCSAFLDKCVFDYIDKDCDDMFGVVLTGKGLACVHNQIPYQYIERNETIRMALSKPAKNDLEKFAGSIDADRISFSKEFLSSAFRSQEVGGSNNGLRFAIRKPPSTTLSSQVFQVLVGNPRDPISLHHDQEFLEYSREHFLRLHALSEYTTEEVRSEVLSERRECVHYNEIELTNYVGYTYTRCNDLSTSEDRPCATISDGDGTRDKELCLPTVVGQEDFEILEDELRFLARGRCEKSCNELKYETSLRWKMLSERLSHNTTHAYPTNHSALVRIFYPDDMVEAKVRTLRTFTAEKIGIVLGMLGFCNEITLPRICQFFQNVIVFALHWVYQRIKASMGPPPTIVTSFHTSSERL